ncbi:MAG: peptide-methionine (S)-S-oxide reductase MsrA [Bacteroidia bacterium]|nr:peptide-methionine (S)-S-oxide reductase MsrA [Bacteroidia bacterium]
MNKLLNKIKVAVTFVAAIFFMSACAQNTTTEISMENKNETNTNKPNSNIDTATLGAGCFWCVEAVFQRLEGVLSIESGYSGGFVKNPAYREVCNGTTGHAEVCRLTYDKTKISFDEILEVFWKTHDPTTLNRQGNDIGTQYRSVVFYHNDEQKALAEKYKEEINKSGAYDKPIITEISPLTNYYKAEEYHQNYYNQNGQEGYCQYVIQPKVEKFEKIFKNKLKK